MHLPGIQAGEGLRESGRPVDRRVAARFLRQAKHGPWRFAGDETAARIDLARLENAVAGKGVFYSDCLGRANLSNGPRERTGRRARFRLVGQAALANDVRVGESR